MLSPKTKRYISQVVPFGLIWMVFAIIYALVEKGLLGDLRYYPSTGNPYNFGGNVFLFIISSTITGLLLGTIEIRYLNKVFSKRSFSQKIAYKTMIYVALMISFLLAITIISNSNELQKGLLDKQVWNNVWIFFSNFAFWSVLLYVAVMIVITLFYAEVSDNLGLGVLNNFFTGKYHQPIEEERVFMFCDMTSSTTIAEKLGHVSFFEMLRAYYSDLSDPIVSFAGEIYMYVGDEIIVSWNLKNGLRNDNCFQCFFAMKTALEEQAKKYQETYGLVPTFKAGIHYGKVTTGEIGKVKKDIMFTGDVLNTTARIQGLCNTYDVNILVSDQLIEKAILDGRFLITSLGESDLRGRDEKVGLYTIQPL